MLGAADLTPAFGRHVSAASSELATPEVSDMSETTPDKMKNAMMAAAKVARKGAGRRLSGMNGIGARSGVITLASRLCPQGPWEPFGVRRLASRPARKVGVD